jgi:capsular polysaccharide biosynthesis protein
VFRAQMDAEAKNPDAGSWLSVVDPAFRPARPTGPGKAIFLLAGLVLFLTLGGALAVGLAVIDDRLYRSTDIDQLGLAVLAVIPPAHGGKAQRVHKEAA